MIHEQVEKQLNYLQKLVNSEEKRKEEFKGFNLPYIPSKRKWENIENLDKYKKEILQNEDKNILVWVNIKKNNNNTLCGVYPFAKRKVGTSFLIHRLENGEEILYSMDSEEIEIVKEAK